MVVAAPKKPIHPALLELGEERARSVQNRVADAITRFAGSMWFAYLHIAWFSIGIASGIERYPYRLLTMIVSLEAIFLSTFVMISQNRRTTQADAWPTRNGGLVQSEEQQNVELIGALQPDPRSDKSGPPADAGAHCSRRPSDVRLDVRHW